MGEGWFMVEIIFMVIIFLYSIYQLFYSETAKAMTEEISEKMEPGSLVGIIRYLILIAFNSFFANMFFDIDWLLWVTLISVVGLGIMLVEWKFDKSSIITIALVLLFFLGESIPRDSYSFVNYISENTEYECLRIECVKINEVITPEDSLKTEVEVLSIEESFFDWYLFFAKGALKLKSEDGNIEELKGINIGGLWLIDK